MADLIEMREEAAAPGLAIYANAPSISMASLTWTRASGEDMLDSAIRLGGVLLYVNAVRVHDVDGIQTATSDPCGFLDDLVAAMDGHGPDRFQTTEIPGHPGDWVVWAVPC